MNRLLLGLLLLLIGNAPPGASIDVSVSGVRSAGGMIRVSVCPESLFLKTCPWSASAPAHPGEVIVVVNNVPPGRYAVQAFHDANANGKLDQNWLGIPREGVGFSNDAMGRLTRPRFSMAAFDHVTVRQRIAVALRYFLG